MGGGCVWVVCCGSVDFVPADADARHAALSRIGLLAGLCLASRALFADGGTVQFQKHAGPFIVTLFSTPVPLRVGAADLSVMLQKAEDRSAVLDAGVAVQLTKSGEPQIRAAATQSTGDKQIVVCGARSLSVGRHVACRCEDQGKGECGKRGR